MSFKIKRKVNIRISKNIPLFKKGENRGKRSSLYPFYKMNKGDSFNAGRYSHQLQHQIGCLFRSFVNYYRLKWKFATRKTKEGNLRVFRVK